MSTPNSHLTLTIAVLIAFFACTKEVLLSPPEDAVVNPAYVEAMVRDGVEYGHPGLSVECESKWSLIENQWVPMAACWGESQTIYTFSSIRHFGGLGDINFDMRIYEVEHASPTTVLMTDCYEEPNSMQMEVDDCISVVSDFEAAERLIHILAEWESY